MECLLRTIILKHGLSNIICYMIVLVLNLQDLQTGESIFSMLHCFSQKMCGLKRVYFVQLVFKEALSFSFVNLPSLVESVSYVSTKIKSQFF